VGTALGLPLQAAIKPARTTTPIFRRGVLHGMAAILKDFAAAVDHRAGRLPVDGELRSVNFQGSGQAEHNRRATDQWDVGTCRECSADGADPEAAGDHQTDFGGETQETLPQRPDGVIDLVDHL
jgi:hypothetical protein